jgi:two-component system cell cycle sensor histidine kinase/response regulator CckA
MILLVEDETVVRELVRVFLERAGYRVLDAANSADALKLGTAHADAICGLLTDIMLPGLDGTKLGQQLCQLIPGLKIIYMSGNVGESVDHADVLQPGTRFLAKPFTRRDLLDTVRDVIGPPRVEE